MNPPPFEIPAAHKYFAANCFNATWGLLDKPSRTAEEDQQMLATSYASLYHWLHRPDCGEQQKSVAYWQLARVSAVIQSGGEALRLAKICLSHSKQLEPFFLGFAHEAMARALWLIGNTQHAKEHLAEADKCCTNVADSASAEMLRADLTALREKIFA